MRSGTVVILARPHDPGAAMLAKRWSSEDVCVITPWDLSTAGWSYRSTEPHASVAMAGGRRLPASGICGVVTRLPCVFEEDLGHMQPADRAYAASEMTAFLLAWLSGLDCPVVNRPTPTLLWGPSWRPEKWARTAASLGIPVEAIRRRAAGRLASWQAGKLTSLPAEGVSVTVVGQRRLGAVDDTLARHARRLAEAAGVEMLSVRFTSSRKGARFLGASIWPDSVTDEMADALREHLRG